MTDTFDIARQVTALYHKVARELSRELFGHAGAHVLHETVMAELNRRLFGE